MDYKVLEIDEIDRQLFHEFNRYQEVTRCYRKVEGKWVIKDVPFIDQWNEDEYSVLIKCLKNTLWTGGVVYGAFSDGKLKGFASVENKFFGEKQEYLDLTSIHVSYDARGQGIGKKLFQLASDWARRKGAKKLYISAHSAVETQAFYKAMGCVEAKEYIMEHVVEEPCDCQLEYGL